MMIDGPEYSAAACPLRTNIPAPKKKVRIFYLIDYFQSHSPIIAPRPIAVN
jgi:hypothetical protein